jgi:hypothetical protein
MSNAVQLVKAKAAYEAADNAVSRAQARYSKAYGRLIDLGYHLKFSKPRLVKMKKRSSAS